MKWIALAILLLAVGGQDTTALIDVDGGNGDGTFQTPRNPFWTTQRITCHSPILVNPEDGETYYTNNVDIIWVWDRTATLCRYRVDSFGWNVIPCNGSISRTFSDGNQVITLEVRDNFCTSSASAGFTIEALVAKLVGDLSPLAYLILVGVIFVAILDEDEERPKPESIYSLRTDE